MAHGGRKGSASAPWRTRAGRWPGFPCASLRLGWGYGAASRCPCCCAAAIRSRSVATSTRALSRASSRCYGVAVPPCPMPPSRPSPPHPDVINRAAKAVLALFVVGLRREVRPLHAHSHPDEVDEVARDDEAPAFHPEVGPCDSVLVPGATAASDGRSRTNRSPDARR